MAKFSELPNSIKKDIALAHGAQDTGMSIAITAEQADELNAMTPHELMTLWCQWHLGNGEWFGVIWEVWEKVSK